jgi:SAM-dependent methyltransferase
MPFGDPPRPYAECPWCRSLERHRTLWAYLQRELKPGDRVLHFAPEPVIARNIRNLTQVTYTGADLNPSNTWLFADIPLVQADITDQPWPDASFEVVIVSHVLEFVLDDAKAMRELRRVVTSDGMVVSLEPYDPTLDTTYEVPPAVRGSSPIRGDTDYVRLYGSDLMTRWEQAGFELHRIATGARPGDDIFEARPQPGRTELYQPADSQQVA